MNIPTKIKVGCFDYSVEELDKVVVDGTEAYGSHDFGNLVIKVQKEMPDSIQASALMHEVMHAIFGFTGLYRTEEDEEHLVEALTNGICSVFKDNPQLLDYLKHKLS